MTLKGGDAPRSGGGVSSSAVLWWVALGTWGLLLGGTTVPSLPVANTLDFPGDSWCGAWREGDEVPAWELDATVISAKL